MDKTTLILIMNGLLIVLLLLVITFVFARSGKKAPKKPAVSKPQTAVKKRVRSFEELKAAIKDKKSSARTMQEALDELLEHYGTIEKKLGIRPHPDFGRYMEILFIICRHRNTNKDIIVDFDRRLAEKNPDYRKEIDDALQRGLSSRGL